MQRRFSQLDVFSTTTLSGNPLAVVVDAEGLTTEQMHRFAQWTNLSETTFLLPPTDPEADYQVRIFTAPKEIPFAGHPSLGSCRAWLEAGGAPQTPGIVVQQSDIGLVRLRVDEDSAHIGFLNPELLRSGPVEEHKVQELADLLCLERTGILDAQWGDNGPGWIMLLLADAEAVLAVQKPTGPLLDLDVGILGLYPEGGNSALEVRGFFADGSGAVIEDPATGSLNGAAAQWLVQSGRLRLPYVATQGSAVGARARIVLEDDDDGGIWVVGKAVTRIVGSVDL